MKKLVRESFKKHVAEVYHFRFDGPSAWAIFTICCETGEFSIQSDWGDWSYRWNVNSLGYSTVPVSERLKHFLCKRPDAHYVVAKLTMNRQEERQVYQADLTKERIQKELLKRRRERDVSKELARNAWDDLEHVDFSNATSLWHTIEDTVMRGLGLMYTSRGHEMTDVAALGDMIVHAPSTRYLFLRDQLLPFFFAHLQEELRRTAKPECHHENIEADIIADDDTDYDVMRCTDCGRLQ